MGLALALFWREVRGAACRLGRAAPRAGVRAAARAANGRRPLQHVARKLLARRGPEGLTRAPRGRRSSAQFPRGAKPAAGQSAVRVSIQRFRSAIRRSSPKPASLRKRRSLRASNQRRESSGHSQVGPRTAELNRKAGRPLRKISGRVFSSTTRIRKRQHAANGGSTAWLPKLPPVSRRLSDLHTEASP